MDRINIAMAAPYVKKLRQVVNEGVTLAKKTGVTVNIDPKSPHGKILYQMKDEAHDIKNWTLRQKREVEQNPHAKTAMHAGVKVAKGAAYGF